MLNLCLTSTEHGLPASPKLYPLISPNLWPTGQDSLAVHELPSIMPGLLYGLHDAAIAGEARAATNAKRVVNCMMVEVDRVSW